MSVSFSVVLPSCGLRKKYITFATCVLTGTYASMAAIDFRLARWQLKTL